MDNIDLERLGLNKNEAKVYYALLMKGEATAQELVKSLGVYRNIIYDNLEKLMEKGLVSFVTDGTKRKFIAEKPTAILEFLETKKIDLDKEISAAKLLLPDISTVLNSHNSKQNVLVFKGIAGFKKVLAEIVQAKKSWCIGITNESVRILGETYWKNYNLKKKETKTEEWLLWNHDFKNTVMGKNTLSHHKVLPKDLDQVIETIMYDNKVAIMVYTFDPIVILIENKEIFETYRKHFEFLWNLSKEKKVS
jgi:predicted DNA-binding transcriptional regulator